MVYLMLGLSIRIGVTFWMLHWISLLETTNEKSSLHVSLKKEACSANPTFAILLLWKTRGKKIHLWWSPHFPLWCGRLCSIVCFKTTSTLRQNECVHPILLELFVSLCAIYKNPQTHLSWPFIKEVMEMEQQTTAARKRWKQQRSRAILTLQKQTIIEDIEALSFKVFYL